MGAAFAFAPAFAGAAFAGGAFPAAFAFAGARFFMPTRRAATFFFVVGSSDESIEAAITNAGDCSSAAGALGLQWAHSFEKAGDYPDCFFANDGCSSVYFNTSPNPSGNLNNFPDYGAVCHAPGT